MLASMKETWVWILVMVWEEVSVETVLATMKGTWVWIRAKEVSV